VRLALGSNPRVMPRFIARPTNAEAAPVDASAEAMVESIF